MAVQASRTQQPIVPSQGNRPWTDFSQGLGCTSDASRPGQKSPRLGGAPTRPLERPQRGCQRGAGGVVDVPKWAGRRTGGAWAVGGPPLQHGRGSASCNCVTAVVQSPNLKEDRAIAGCGGS